MEIEMKKVKRGLALGIGVVVRDCLFLTQSGLRIDSRRRWISISAKQ